jgi:hypothetical protein
LKSLLVAYPRSLPFRVILVRLPILGIISSKYLLRGAFRHALGSDEVIRASSVISRKINTYYGQR